ncbi:hypothetical protein TNCV_3482521 [Trichonephila clavipes]|nr:hypothetical protein TNCV_3482521 [Trichonephila clavipes]
MLKEGPIIPIQSSYTSTVVLCLKNNELPPDNPKAYRFAVDHHFEHLSNRLGSKHVKTVVYRIVENRKRHFSKVKQFLTLYVQDIELRKKLVPNPQEERCKSKGDEFGPEENDLRSPARTTRVDTTGSSPNTRVTKIRSRIQGTDNLAVIVQDKVEAPDSKIARRQTEVQRKGEPYHWKSLLGMSRTGECLARLYCFIFFS